MKLDTKNKSVELVVKTRKIIAISKILKDDKFEDAFFKAVRDCNIEILAQIILILAENGESINPFNGIDDVCDFLDEYIAENKKNYSDIYFMITEVINEKGFFREKMTKKALQERINDIMSSVNYEDIIKKSVEKVAEEAVTEEFKGYPA